MIKKILIISILFFSLLNTSFGIYITPKVQTLYDNVFLKLEKKYDLYGQQKALLNLKAKINSLKNHKKYKNNKKIITLFNQILYLNDEKLIEIRKEIILNKLEQEKELEESKKIVEKKAGQNRDYSKEYELEKTRRKAIIDKYSYSKYFKNISLTKNNIFLEDGVWKAYNFTSYSFFPPEANITEKDLKHNGVNLDTDLLFVTDNDTVGFIKNPTKLNLISDEIIKDIDNKYYFLEEVLDDVKKSGITSYDSYFKELKSKTERITANLNDVSKIGNIYNYILTNTSYSKTIDFNNYKIFSGIETFKNNDGVCAGYAKLMTYMLMFSGIDDATVIRGYVIDAEDFPDVGHAWVKVGDKYYDPTFDDPVGATSDRSFRDYKYFNLPKDLFYTNRYDFKDIPENIKKLSLEERKKIILDNLNEISEKYKDDKYNLLKLINFKKEHKIKYDEKITLDNFDKILDLYEVDNFSFTLNGKKRDILKLKYYNIDEFDLEVLLEQLDYNLYGHYFFKWYDEKGGYNYRLAYDVELR